MKNKWISFLDLDKCVADYNQSFLDIIHQPLTQEIKNGIKNGERINDILNMDFSPIFKKMLDHGKDFWANIPLFPWSHDLYNSLRSIGEVCFLTSTGTRNSPAAQGKQEWVRKHFKTENMIITHHKFFCAKPNSVLIDDCLLDTQKKEENNCLLFEEWGGNSYLFPNYMKILDNEIKYEDVKKEILDKIENIKINICG